VNRYRIRHVTRYDYEAPVVHAHHLANLCPRALGGQKLSSFELRAEPTPVGVSRYEDYFGNAADEIEILSAHDVFEVTASSVVEVSLPVFDRASVPETPWDEFAERLRDDPYFLCVREYCFDSPLIRPHAQLAAYAASTFTPRRPLISALLELNRRVHAEFTYDPTVTDVSTPLARVLRDKRGVCQDFAHLTIGCLRSLGLAARYVSGYLETVPPPGQPRLVGADASHAWASVYVPHHGWLDFDPTNDVIPSDRHVTLAYGRDFSDASPLRGVVLGGGAHRLSVSVDVQAATAGSLESA
jgi:transglutaminase-like putative cysteine protease